MAKRIKVSPIPDLSAHLSPALLGQAVRARRTQSNLKLTDAAALCNVSKQTLANIENGIETTQLKTILQVCRGLGIALYIHTWMRSVDPYEWQ